MSVEKEILTVGFDKNGEADFGVGMSVCELTFAQMKELRAMIPVAIGVLENIWRDAQMRKPENMAADATVRPNAELTGRPLADGPGSAPG